MDRPSLLARAAMTAFLNRDGRRDVALRREAVTEVDAAADPLRSSVVHEQLGRALWNFGDTAAALSEYETAVTLMPTEPPTAERARVLAGFGQMLMLIDRWRDLHRVCEEAIAIARQVGARGAEGHALNTFGLDLMALGRPDEGAAALEQALAIAVDLRDVDDIGRAYINLADAWFFGGDCPRAADVIEEGVRVANLFGIATRYGTLIRQTGVLILYDLGRWQTASRLAAESWAISPVGPEADRYGLSRWVNLLVSTGSAEAAGRLERLGELIGEGPVEAQFTAPYYGALAELAIWNGRPADALETLERGLADLAIKDTLYWHLLRLHRLGARAAADLAEVGRARRDPAIERDAVRRGSDLREARERILGASLARRTGRAADKSLAEAATAAAEDSRLHDTPDPAPWRVALARWRAQDRPYMVAYVRYREAEASLALSERRRRRRPVRGRRGRGRPRRPAPVRRDRVPCRTREDPARAVHAGRARGGGGVASVDSSTAPTSGSIRIDPAGTARSSSCWHSDGRIVRSARQLFISGNTAGVHVSNILGKLGASSRAEAAAMAVRLGLVADR